MSVIASDTGLGTTARVHDLPLITTIAAAFTAAWLMGLLTQRLGLSPIVGYLVAGVLIGPHTPGFVADLHLAHQLAEIGVILLMFGVGLHFHVKDLLAVKGIAIPGAAGQILVATVLGMLSFAAFGVPLSTGAVMGMAIAVASTVVLMRLLMDADVLNTPQGHVAVGWLLVEDLFTVIVLVLIPVLGQGAVGEDGSGQGLWVSLGMALFKLAAAVALLVILGWRAIPWVLVHVARLRSRELFTLTVLVFSIAIASATYMFFGASTALGAFIAGMVVAQSPVSHQAAADALPLRDAFAVLFFVAVGMLFDPAFVFHQPLMILAALTIVLIAKPLTALVIVVVLGRSSRTALTVALALAQIGEFSFILSEVARSHGLMPEAGHNVLVATAILSITLSPLLFRAVDPIEAWLARHPRWWLLLNARAEQRARRAIHDVLVGVGHVVATGDRRLAVVVGFGPVGRAVDTVLREAGLATVVVDMNMDTVLELTAQGQVAIFGDASREAILEQAGVRRAAYLILALPHGAPSLAVALAARSCNPELRILTRAHYLGERSVLERAGVTAAVFEEGEAAVGLARLILADVGTGRDRIERILLDLRLRLVRENIADLRAHLVRNVMLPWTRVLRLSTAASHEEVTRRIAQWRHSRWPVTDAQHGEVVGYLNARDLAVTTTGGRAVDDWTTLIRPVPTVHPEDDIESTMALFQHEGLTLAVAVHAGIPIGLVTLEDILERVVDRIANDPIAREPVVLLDALAAGGVVEALAARTPGAAIVELAGAIASDRIPDGVDVPGLAQERELEIPTDLGVGVAIPHARCPGLRAPILVLGRSRDGIAFSDPPAEPVHLVALLVTPAERPDVQVSLLAHTARLVGDRDRRTRLGAATTASAIIALVEEYLAVDCG